MFSFEAWEQARPLCCHANHTLSKAAIIFRFNTNLEITSFDWGCRWSYIAYKWNTFPSSFMKNKISKQLITIVFFFISAFEEFRAPVFCTIVYNNWLSSSSEAKDIFLRVELKFCRYNLRGRIVFQWQEYKFVHLFCVCLFSCIRETFFTVLNFKDFHKLFPCFLRIILA